MGGPLVWMCRVAAGDVVALMMCVACVDGAACVLAPPAMVAEGVECPGCEAPMAVAEEEES
jgi:hypothetical protein